MTGLRGTRLPSLDPADLVTGVEEVRPPLLEGIAGAERVVLLPDVHYPYHPSTGMVTNPAVVDALLSTLTVRLPNSAVSVALRSGDGVDTARTAGFLGYDDVTDSNDVTADVLDADETIAGESIDGAIDGSIAVPAALADATVVPVPSARIAGSIPMMGSLGLVANALGANPKDPAQVRRALDAVDLGGALVDATYTFTGTPHRARSVFCGGDVATVERALADLLGVDRDDVPGLSGASGSASGSEPATDASVRADGQSAVADADSTVEGLDVSALAAELPDGGLPESNDPHPVVRAGYRLYTTVSGDVYPPQLRADR